MAISVGYAALYGTALALLSGAWLDVVRRAATKDGPTMGQVLGQGLLMHAIVIFGPPFLSDDVLYYAALGRALFSQPESAASPLCTTLGASHPFVAILDAHWRCSVSSYQPGFHLLARLIGGLGGTDLALHLRLYQSIAALGVLGAGALTAASLVGSEHKPAYGAALVVLNPLSLIEGTMNAHNDALLALACALFVLAVRRKIAGLALGSLALGLLIKLSGLLLAGLYLTHRILRWLRPRWPALWRLAPIGLAVGLLGGLLFLALWPSALPGLSGLIGSPKAPWEYCTRSLECLPRAILRWGFELPTAAWSVGLAFRFVSGLWLIYAAWRSQQRLLPWLATGLLIYYLYLHAWSQSWYLLPLLPLLPWAEGTTFRALRCVSISGCAYYALVLIGNCFRAELAVALTDLVQGLVVVVPPSVLLYRGRPRAGGSVLRTSHV